MDIFKNDILKDAVFCYSKTNGQGFVHKDKCPCYLEKQKCCKAYLEREEFYELYEKLKLQGLSRSEILKEIDSIQR